MNENDELTQLKDQINDLHWEMSMIENELIQFKDKVEEFFTNCQEEFSVRLQIESEVKTFIRKKMLIYKEPFKQRLRDFIEENNELISNLKHANLILTKSRQVDFCTNSSMEVSFMLNNKRYFYSIEYIVA